MNASASGRFHVEHVMGMAVSIDIRDANCPTDAIGEVVTWLHHVDQTFSTYRLESPISALGRGELTLGNSPEEIREVLRRCEALRLETDGAFDAFDVPAPNGTRLDPSGFVKGWAIERAAGVLEGYGCRNFCINAGGDIAVRGHRTDTTPWLVGIRHPDEPNAIAFVVEAAGRVAVATSATYERGAHIIDPRNGQPAIDIASATVVGPDLGTADAYATALFVMGIEGLDWIEAKSGYDGYVISYDEETFWSSGFDQYRLSGPILRD